MDGAVPLAGEREVDAVAEAVGRLAEALPAQEDSVVLLGFLEDGLREGLEAVEGLESHFTEVLEALRSGRVAPATLLQVAEDVQALGHVERLIAVLPDVRRRLSRAARLLHGA